MTSVTHLCTYHYTMPFTFSHTAIVLPLTKVSRKTLPLTGLVIGSLSPDFEYFLHFRMYGETFHTWWGVWAFCLPISLIIYVLFHRYIKTLLIGNLPTYFQHKFADMLGDAWKNELKLHTLGLIMAISMGLRLWINPQMWNMGHFIVNSIAIGFCSLLLISLIHHCNKRI